MRKQFCVRCEGRGKTPVAGSPLDACSNPLFWEVCPACNGERAVKRGFLLKNPEFKVGDIVTTDRGTNSGKEGEVVQVDSHVHVIWEFGTRTFRYFPSALEMVRSR